MASLIGIASPHPGHLMVPNPVSLFATIAPLSESIHATCHDALFANQFVSLYTQRIHRSLHPRQQQFRRRSTNAGTLKRQDLFLLPTNLQVEPFDLSADELKGHSALKSSGTS